MKVRLLRQDHDSLFWKLDTIIARKPHQNKARSEVCGLYENAITSAHSIWMVAKPSLSFIGLLWLARMNSSFLSGVAEDSEHLTPLIADESD